MKITKNWKLKELSKRKVFIKIKILLDYFTLYPIEKILLLFMQLLQRADLYMESELKLST